LTKSGTHTITLSVSSDGQTATDTQSIFVSDVYDNFSSGVLDETDKWTVTNFTGAYPSVSDGKLVMRFPSTLNGSFETNVRSQCYMSGDFDIQVLFSLDNWILGAPYTGVRVGFGLEVVGSSGKLSVERTSYRAGDSSGHGETEKYIAAESITLGTPRTFAGPDPDVGSATDLSGRLRLFRSGSTIQPFYWNGSSWEQLGSDSITSSDVYIRLLMGAENFSSSQDIQISFDNVTINGGTVVCP